MLLRCSSFRFSLESQVRFDNDIVWIARLCIVNRYILSLGFGAGLSNVTTLTLMGRAFYTSRPMAMAALAMGGATAGAVVTPIMQWCINRYTWRGALLILGGYSLHGIAFGFAIEPLYNTIVQKRQNALIPFVLTDENRNARLPGECKC